MGTNYYAHVDTCLSCGKPEQKIHIGKQSAGWKFFFRAYKLDAIELKGDVPLALDSFTQWMWFLEQSNVDIYDDSENHNIPAPIFLRQVTERQDAKAQPGSYDGVYQDAAGYDFSWQEFS